MCHFVVKFPSLFQIFLAWPRICLQEKVQDKERKSNKSEMEKIMG